MNKHEPILIAENLHKTFYDPCEVEILKGVSLSVSPGETIAIIGASGEGKSTLLHILGTLEPPCQGTMKIMGNDALRGNRNTLRNKHIGFVFQNFHLLEDYTIMENVLMPARIGRKKTGNNSQAQQHAKKLLEMVGLSSRENFYAKLLSGGEKQRAAIARALCNDPNIILADEPAGNLDHHTSQNIYNILLDCAKKYNKALIVVTHDLEFAQLCDKTFHLSEGMIK